MGVKWKPCGRHPMARSARPGAPSASLNRAPVQTPSQPPRCTQAHVRVGLTGARDRGTVRVYLTTGAVVAQTTTTDQMTASDLDAMASHLAAVARRHTEAQLLDSDEQAREQYLQAVAYATSLTDHLRVVQIGLVASARERGATWEQVGQATGTTRQSAHERYA